MNLSRRSSLSIPLSVRGALPVLAATVLGLSACSSLPPATPRPALPPLSAAELPPPEPREFRAPRR